MFILGLVLLLLSSDVTAEYSDKKPVWEQITKLICRGNHRFVHVSDYSKKESLRAVLEIDFVSNSVKNISAMGITDLIESRGFKYYSEGKAVLYFKSSILTISRSKKSLGLSFNASHVWVEWVELLEGGEFTNVSENIYQCYPN